MDLKHHQTAYSMYAQLVPFEALRKCLPTVYSQFPLRFLRSLKTKKKQVEPETRVGFSESFNFISQFREHDDVILSPVQQHM